MNATNARKVRKCRGVLVKRLCGEKVWILELMRDSEEMYYKNQRE